MSMDTGLVLRMELTAILAPGCATMPATCRQNSLQTCWNTAMGDGWYSRFARFDVGAPLRQPQSGSSPHPHAVYTWIGQRLAIKVQYPGVAG